MALDMPLQAEPPPPSAALRQARPATPLPLPLQAFEHALRRAGRGPLGDDNTALPDNASTAPPPLQAAAERPALAPQAVAEPTAVVQHLRALDLPASSLPSGQWQLQLQAPGIEPPLLQLQRGPEGALHLVLHTPVEQQRSTPLAALRDRLQARGQSLDTRPETRLDTDPDIRIQRHQPEDPP